MYVITSSGSTINIKYQMDNITLQRDKIGSINQKKTKIIFAGTDNSRLYGIDFTEGITIDGVTQTTVAMALTTLLGLITTGIIQSFTATPAQTDFIPVFTCTSTTKVFVNGYRVVAGWSIVTGFVRFAVALLGGEEVIIEN